MCIRDRFEAMSAIDIMDPKMDAGMRCNRKRTVLQMDDAIEVNCFIQKVYLFVCFLTISV